MKKNILYTTLFATIGLVSCSKDFLNEPKPTSSVSRETAFGSSEGAWANMAGILRSMRLQYSRTDTGNITSLYFARTVKGNDFMVRNNWFTKDYEHDNRDPNTSRSSFSWDYLYSLIGKINDEIDGVEKATTISTAVKNQLLGQAYTMRAYLYFELSLEFQHTYTYNTKLFAPPIYTEANKQAGNPLSTQEELYAFILKDIEKAIEIGSQERINKSYFNKQVTYALAARVHQVMGGKGSTTEEKAHWTKAIDYAKKSYGEVADVTTLLIPEVYKNGFNNMDEGKEWILAIPQSSTQSTYYWFAPSVFTEHEVAAYKNTFVNKTLVQSFSSTDVRGGVGTKKQGKLFGQTNKTDFQQYYTRKFAFSFDAHTPLIRVPEMILIAAEGLYHTGSEADAHTLLYALQKNRDASATQSTNTGTALLDEILLERRKELYGEIGVEWYDAKRLQKGITRDSWHNVNLSTNPILANDKRFYLLVPQGEIDANDKISRNINDNR